MIKKETYLYGLLFPGNGATISRCPLLNIPDSGKKYYFCFWNCWLSRSFSDWNKKDGTFICNQFFKPYVQNRPVQIVSDTVLFDGALNVQLSGRPLKVNDPKLTVMRCVKHTVSLFFNDVSMIPIANQIISAHKMIYNILGSSHI